MTYDQLIDFITKKVGQIDSYSQGLCGTFINRRYQMIWDSENWKDACIPTVSTAVADTTIQNIPASLERVISVKFEDTWLENVDIQFLIETDPSIFNRPGFPKFYTEHAIGAGQNTIRLYPVPETASTMGWWGRRKFTELTSSDSPIIRNIDNCLIAFVMGDMLQRMRQYEKAKQCIEEAASLLELMRKMEKEQSNLPRKSKKLTVLGDSLTEMRDAVSARTGSWRTSDVILIDEYLRREYLDVYDSNLWPESTVIAEMDRDGPQVVLPHYFDRVVSVRQNVNLGELVPTEQNLYFGLNAQIFEQSGSPVAYSILTAVALPVLPPETERLVFVSSSASDVGVKIFIRGEILGVEVEETVILDGITPVHTGYDYDTPLTIAKPLTVGDVTISGLNSFVFLGRLYSQDRERKHMRLWLQPAPQDADGNKVLILGKRQCKPLHSDEDTPLIRNIGNLLINRACSCMFTNLGNKEMADMMSKKADTALSTLVSRETLQNAYSSRILPYTDDLPYGAGSWGDYCY